LQSKHSRKPVIVKLNPDGSYSWEKIVTTAAAADARPQVMVTVIYMFCMFNNLYYIKN
jgi:hypothetical protein